MNAQTAIAENKQLKKTLDSLSLRLEKALRIPADDGYRLKDEIEKLQEMAAEGLKEFKTVDGGFWGRACARQSDKMKAAAEALEAFADLLTRIHKTDEGLPRELIKISKTLKP